MPRLPRVDRLGLLHHVFRYIDQNPVGARLANDALAYPHGSAGSQSGASRQRPWLCRSLVDRFLGAAIELGATRVDAYRRAFGPWLSPALARFVGRRIADLARELDPLDDLVGTANANVRSWMERKARLADGTRPGLPLVTPETTVAVVEASRRRSPHLRVPVGPRTDRSLWDVVLVALQRELAGETFASKHTCLTRYSFGSAFVLPADPVSAVRPSPRPTPPHPLARAHADAPGCRELEQKAQSVSVGSSAAAPS